MSKLSCLHTLLGPWEIEHNMVRAMYDMAMFESPSAVKQAFGQQDTDDDASYEVDGDGIAHMNVRGTMTKGQSSFGGTSTVQLRRDLRDAAQRDDVKSILLHVDSPGGTVSGLTSLVDDVNFINQNIKPIDAHVDGMAASAAYRAITGVRGIYAERGARIGSIGTVAVLTDTTGQQEKSGVKLELVTSGGVKGLGMDGKVTEELKAEVQEQVDQMTTGFVQDIAEGRSLSIEQVSKWADGRIYDPQMAVEMNMIDHVATVDQAVHSISEKNEMSKENAPAGITQEDHEAGVQSAANEGFGKGAEAEKLRFQELQEAYGDKPEFVMEAFDSGKSVSSVAKDYAALLRKDNDTLKKQLEKAQASEQEVGGDAVEVVSTGSAVQGGDSLKDADPEKQAEKEWEANYKNCQDGFSSKDSYVTVRKFELAGVLKVKN